MEEKYLIVDGNNLLYSSYHVSKKITWKITNGTTFFFLRVLISILRKEDYQKLIIFFDGGGKNWRKEIIPEYKEQRTGMPEELLEQAEKIKLLLKNIGISQLEIRDCEADDLIASFVKKNKEKNKKFNIFTRDKDLLQSLDLQTNIIKYINGKTSLYTEKDFYNEYNFSPLNYIDYLSLIGDDSDNISGIKGIGPVGAKKLIQEFNSIENIYKNFSFLPENIKKILKDGEELLQKNKKIIKLSDNIDLKFNETNFSLINFKKNTFFRNFCQENNFESILKILR